MNINYWQYNMNIHIASTNMLNIRIFDFDFPRCLLFFSPVHPWLAGH